MPRYPRTHMDEGLRVALKVFAGVCVFALFIYLAAGGCGKLASQSNAESALTTQGFSNVHLLKRHTFLVGFQGCGKEDVAKFDFKAINPAGKLVNVSVCEGWPFKGATIRSTN